MLNVGSRVRLNPKWYEPLVVYRFGYGVVIMISTDTTPTTKDHYCVVFDGPDAKTNELYHHTLESDQLVFVEMLTDEEMLTHWHPAVRGIVNATSR